MSCLIHLDGVTYQHQHKTIVEDIHLKVGLSEIVTTTLRNRTGVLQDNVS